MAISVVSDLVMDVVRAADPLDVQVAQDKLKANKAAFAASSLADAGKGFDAAVGVLNDAASKAGLGDTNLRAERKEIPETFRQFEASVLRTFIGSMLPQESEEVYGKGNAGEIWKGMLAEQLANSMTENGGIGIAEQVYQDTLRKAENRNFENISSLEDKDNNAALRMVAEFERKVLGISDEMNGEAKNV
ncbi:rod-binding protein [Agrobacterium sp.]|uniref:rod-binding protein n=1 Tax=Agrobacterium sp. TaxID=361 RepID=UPI0028ACECAA|nr:rod-binding protein [Agrobacterium sp.]